MREADHRQTHPEGLTGTQEALSLQLLRMGAIQFGDFVLSSGSRSSLYVDLRMVSGDPLLRGTVIDQLDALTSPIHYDVLTPVPSAGTTYTSILADRYNVPLLTPAQEKPYGNKVRIHGFQENHRGQTALVIDDTLSTGNSVKKAIDTMREGGLLVRDAAVIVDRQQGGREALAAIGVKLHSLMNLRQVFDYFTRVGEINNIKREEILRELEDSK